MTTRAVEMPAAQADHTSQTLIDNRGDVKGGKPDTNTPLAVRDELMRLGLIRSRDGITKSSLIDEVRDLLRNEQEWFKDHGKTVAAPIVARFVVLLDGKPTNKELAVLLDYDDEPITRTTVVEVKPAKFADDEGGPVQEYARFGRNTAYKQRVQRYKKLAQYYRGEYAKGETPVPFVVINGQRFENIIEALLSGRVTVTGLLAAWRTAAKPPVVNWSEFNPHTKAGIVRSAKDSAAKVQVVVRELREEEVNGRPAKIHRRKRILACSNDLALFGAIVGLIEAGRRQERAVELTPEQKQAIANLLNVDATDDATDNDN